LQCDWDNRLKSRVRGWIERPRVPTRTRRFRIPQFRPARLHAWPAGLGILLILGGVELRTSWVESLVLSGLARQLRYSVEPGPSSAIRYPTHGPYNDRLGYAKLPDFLARLEQSGYRIEAQARNSPLSITLADFGLYPIYPEKSQAGLQIAGANGLPLFSSRFPGHAYMRFEDVPPLIVHSLLYIENREALEDSYRYSNPSVEWDRLAGAFVDLGLNTFRSGHRLSGGSTLATQIEKVRHSPGGRTGSLTEKLRQMAAASLRAYQGGQETVEARRRIVVDYLNSVPLSAIRRHGEIHGLGDGLWAWYGADFGEVNRLLAHSGSGTDETARGRAYRQALSLLLAINSPSKYLRGHSESLDERTDAYLHLLAKDGVISVSLRDASLRERSGIQQTAPPVPATPFSFRKGSDLVRAQLLSLLGLKDTYALDRLDLSVETPLDGRIQESVTEMLQRLNDREVAARAGILGEHLIQSSDPARVIYSFTLYETSGGVNLLRVQADNYDQPLNINESTRLQLGSTAKLPTLLTYLTAVAELHGQYAGAGTELQQRGTNERQDPLTEWAIGYLQTARDKSLAAMLDAAMQRRYSASPGESFFTGGGLHQFSNFDPKDDERIVTVSDAFARSVNLVFIRLMRDIVKYYTHRLPGYSQAMFESLDQPARKGYLDRFVEMEGKQYLAKFYAKYHGQIPDESIETLGIGIHPTPRRLATIYRSLRPNAGLDEFAAFLKAHLPSPMPDAEMVEQLYRMYARDKFNLTDRGFLAGVHPLELWLVEYLRDHPKASLDEVFNAGNEARQDSYKWLYRTRFKGAQDQRIRTMLERDAFAEILKEWRRQGYPFRSMTPSYASALGSSGDTPAALAELAGILLNDGVRRPTPRIRKLHFAAGTPLETIVSPAPGKPERVYPPEIAEAGRKAMIGVVERGTGRRAFGAVVLPDGRSLPIGGKTGTGDNRFEVYGAGGRPIESRVLHRTAAFVFFIGDRFFGTVTAYVPGKMAGDYEFTSALPAQAFRYIAASIFPLATSEPGTLLAKR